MHPKCCFERIVLNKCKNELSHFSSPEFNFSDQFKKIIKRYKNVGYNLVIITGA